jgi:hypothetical protein
MGEEAQEKGKPSEISKSRSITADQIPDQMAMAYRSPESLSHSFSGRWLHCRRSVALPPQQFEG